MTASAGASAIAEAGAPPLGPWLAASPPAPGELGGGLLERVLQVWASGGWLMFPLLALAVFTYATALELFLRAHFHFLLRAKVHKLDAAALASGASSGLQMARQLARLDAPDVEAVRRRFEEVRGEYLPYFDRRIRFLGALVATGPLIGLLGTVTGMLTTFAGMVDSAGNRFDSIVTGISEALITTQTGLVIAIPAMVALSFIVQRRGMLALAIARLERYNIRLVLRADCPVPARLRRP